MAGKERINLDPEEADLHRHGDLFAYFNEPWQSEYVKIWQHLRGEGRKHYEAQLRADRNAARKARWQERPAWGAA